MEGPLPGSRDDSNPQPRPIKKFVWDEHPQRLDDILSTRNIPFVAQLYEDKSKVIPPWQLSEDGENTVLHFTETKTQKMVICRKMQWDRKTSEYVTVDKTTEIPATCTGWFEVLPEDGHPVEYFDSIQAIANVKPRRFLVRTSIVGYQLSLDNGVSSWVPLELQPGQVLTTGIVYMDQKKTKSNVKNFFKKFLKPSKQSHKDQELKYLQCFDGDAREVMIPLIMTGVFSPVGDVTNNDYDCVYELQDLVTVFSLPVRTQLVHADSDLQKIPHGLVTIESVRDEELVVVGKYPVDNYTRQFEIPVNAPILLKKDVSKRRQKKVTNNVHPEEQVYENTCPKEVELPVRIKTNKKAKGQGILEKLSLRSKARKERASMKQLQEEGVFSSRLTKSEFNLESALPDSSELDDSEIVLEQRRPSSYAESDPVYRSSYPIDDVSYQNRNLPPIPAESRTNEKEALYEELPVAPHPPETNTFQNIRNTVRQSASDDDYMSPAQVRHMVDPSVIYSKPPIAPRSSIGVQSRKSKDVSPGNKSNKSDVLDFDELFPFTEDGYVDKHPSRQQVAVEQPQYQTTVNAQTTSTSPYAEITRRLPSDDPRLDRETFINPWSKIRSRSQKNLTVDANVTVRSHNVRNVNNVMDVFNIDNTDDSTRDLPPDSDNPPLRNFNHRLSLFEPSPYERRSFYAMSEPGGKRYQRSMSSSGLNEIMSYSRQGEDSVLSGDYGYHGDSEYSYSEYFDYQDDGWRPPSDLSNLSVKDVSRSLRYIGMKDRVVKRLANESIDGQLLCSLDKQLLREGFPELNALDIKKIIDFINGWRPKK